MIDALKFHQHNLLTLEPILNLIDSLKFETEYAVQFYGIKLISWLHQKLINTHYHEQFKVVPSFSYKFFLVNIINKVLIC